MTWALEHRADKWEPVFRNSRCGSKSCEIAIEGQRGHLLAMAQQTPRATKRPKTFAKPAHWTNTPAPTPEAVKGGDDGDELSPTRYGDWVRNGIAVDF
jgi:hypothetical protein